MKTFHLIFDLLACLPAVAGLIHEGIVRSVFPHGDKVNAVNAAKDVRLPRPVPVPRRGFNIGVVVLLPESIIT